jgi:hypothetical protein
MKRLLVLLAGAALAVGLYTTTASGTQQAVTPGQFAALSKKVAILQKDVRNLKADFSCLQVLGTSQFGDGQTNGYHYKQPDGSEILTSALDVTTPGETPTIVLAQVDPTCVSASRFQRGSRVARSSR